MGFLVILVVTVGATLLAFLAATGLLLLLFQLMRAFRMQLTSHSTPWQLKSSA